ncbi:MAG: alginate export family protein, partial [Candidatus Aminicenantales bacterium]
MAVAWLKNLKQKKFGRPIFTSLLLFLLIFPFPLSLRADFYQSKLFSASFSLRLRGELDHNFNIRSYGPGASDNFLLSRARFEFTLTPISFLSFHVQIQDAEVLGSRFSDADFSGKNNPYHDPFDLNQLYLDFQPNQAFFLRAGRQSVSLGDNRVFGPGEWGNTGRYAWDALLTR